MRKRNVTSFDVATRAGVSQSAVSRAFSGSPKVSEATRTRIFAVATELGYCPNAIARSLITHRTNMIGMVMGEVTNPFYPQILQAFTVKLREFGRRVMLFTIPPGGSLEEELPQVLQYRVDGVIVTSATLTSEASAQCARLGAPIVLVNRYVRGASLSSVSCDNTEGARFVANLLLDAGHRRFAFIAGIENTSTNVDRERGYVGRLNERGVDVILRDGGNYTYAGGYQAAKRLLSAAALPDAIFCANDIMALGALDAARREAGLRVPEDVSIVGFDDIQEAEWPSHDLTTVRQRINLMVAETVGILLERITRPDLPPVTRLIPGDFVARGTARLPAGMGRGRFAVSAWEISPAGA